MSKRWWYGIAFLILAQLFYIKVAFFPDGLAQFKRGIERERAAMGEQALQEGLHFLEFNADKENGEIFVKANLQLLIAPDDELAPNIASYFEDTSLLLDFIRPTLCNKSKETEYLIEKNAKAAYANYNNNPNIIKQVTEGPQELCSVLYAPPKRNQ